MSDFCLDCNEINNGVVVHCNDELSYSSSDTEYATQGSYTPTDDPGVDGDLRLFDLIIQRRIEEGKERLLWSFPLYRFAQHIASIVEENTMSDPVNRFEIEKYAESPTNFGYTSPSPLSIEVFRGGVDIEDINPNHYNSIIERDFPPNSEMGIFHQDGTWIVIAGEPNYFP